MPDNYRARYAGLIFQFALAGVLSYYGMKWLMNLMDPTRKSRLAVQKQAEQMLKKIGVKNVKLSEYEMSVAADLIDLLSIPVTWEDIGGLNDTIEEVKETIILPFQRKELFEKSALLSPPKGVLLYGPPGCGKTMIAKATAKEADCRFINLQVSSLTDKWYGESQKLAAAVFSLAIKLQPCIIFIDEIDSFLRSRDKSDHEATAMMKAQFMSLWDGLLTDSSCQVIVMGATNRPQDVDSAILRRMPSTFHIGLPNLQQRCDILHLILDKEKVDNDVDIEEISRLTEGHCGSELKEICRAAAMLCVRDYLKEKKLPRQSSNTSIDESVKAQIRPIKMDDFLTSVERFSQSGLLKQR